MDFQVITWESNDVEMEGENLFQISMYGRSESGKSVCCNVEFTPYFYIECDNTSHVTSLLNKYIMNDIVDCRIVRMKKFFGFTNNIMFRFVRLIFKTQRNWKLAYYILRKSKFKNQIYEANIDPILRFIHHQSIESTGWVNVSQYTEYLDDEKNTMCDIEIKANHYKNVHPIERDDISPLIIASFDIETYSPDGSFPEASKAGCEIIQIATSYQRYGSDLPYHTSLITLKACNEIPGTEVTCCSTENELITAWCACISKHDPDMMVGYNIWKFDLAYIYNRAKFNCIENIFSINRLKHSNSVMYKAKFSSSAYGDNEYEMVTSHGRMQIDLLELYKREHKLVSYSLNNVSSHFLGDQKVAMTIKDMFATYKEGTPAGIAEIGKYCIKDTQLPIMLMNKLNDVPNLIEMAKATCVPMNYLLQRGQQIKVFSQIAKQTREHNMLIVTIHDGKNDDGFVGATVLDACTGAYMDEVVTGLDFASLYPSIMRAHNLCYNTIVLNEEYANLENVTYETIAWEVDGKEFKYKFVQNEIGILPMILEKLSTSRSKAKKDMARSAQNNDVFMKNVYNGKQLAFKVSMNSIYGFCAAYMLPCQAISASVTTIGRSMIYQTKTMVEELYPGSKVIYGDTDSVMVIFKTKTTNILKESFELGIEAAECISNTFKNPIKLEFEKCYYPYLLFSKKRYAGLMFTNPGKPDYIDAKGIQLVRRDNAEFVRDISKKVLHMIMYDRAIIEAMEYVKQEAQHLLDGDIPIEKMIVSKSLRKDYKNVNQPHVHVAAKIEQRKPGTGPKCGERVPYVIIETDNPKHLQYQKAEDPDFVIACDLKLDLLYYLEHSLSSPIVSLFELFFDNPKHQLFSELVLEFKKKRDKQSSITGFFNRTSVVAAVTPTTLSVIQKSNNTKKTKPGCQKNTINLYF